VVGILETLDVWKRYFIGKWVLQGITFRLDKRGIVGIIGKNGAGKTTFIKIISGLVKPTKGKVFLEGEDIYGGTYEFKDKIGVLLHDNILYEELTVEENLEYYAKIYGLGGYDDSVAAAKAFETLGLDLYRDTKVGHLSFGWKKRANIIRALINDPRLIIMDEPVSGLDEVATNIVAELLVELSREKAIIFTISNQEDLDLLLDKGLNKAIIYRLEGGNLVEYR
jgi:ABC-type multidrug transport system ATPase subunit